MWIREASPAQRRTLPAGFLGYGVDGFDFMIYTFVIPTLIAAWGMTRTEAGYIATASLVTSSVGGWFAGMLADCYGRVRILQLTLVWFAVFTFLSGFAHSYHQLTFTRGMQGFGFGGEWSVGSVLVAESVAARHRGRAAGLVQSSWAVGWALRPGLLGRLRRGAAVTGLEDFILDGYCAGWTHCVRTRPCRGVFRLSREPQSPAAQRLARRLGDIPATVA